MKNKLLLSLFLFLCFFKTIFSQDNYLSSQSEFETILKKAKENLKNSNEDSIINYLEKLKPYSKSKSQYNDYIRYLINTIHFFDTKGSFEKSIKVAQEGIDIAERYNDSTIISEILADMSHSYRLFQDYKKAIVYGKKAVEVLPDNEEKENFLLKANALNMIAAAHTEKGYPDSAIVFQKKVLDFLPKVDSFDIKNTFVNIGYAFMETNRLPEAKLYTETSLKLYRPTKSDYAMASIFTNLGMYGRRAKDHKYSLQMFDSAIYYAKKSKYIETFEWIYEERAQVYQALNNYKKVSEDLNNLLIIKDSMFTKQRDKNAQEIEAVYQTAKKEKQILKQREELLAQKLAIKNRTVYTILLASLLVIFGVSFFAIYKRNQLKRKQLQKEIDLKDALAKIKTQNRLQEQRLRISRDLHDNIGSQLTFIISSIDNLKFISKNADKKLKNKLANISSFTGDTIHQLRDTIWAMNKNEISMEDLHSRILSFVEKAKIATQHIEFSINNDVHTDFSFSSVQGINIFRVIQEAINNAIKYAEAKTISIDIEQQKNDLVFVVKDDGIGFSIAEVTLGNGLSNMEKRMSEIDGKVLIDSKNTLGTSVTLKIKINTTDDV